MDDMANVRIKKMERLPTFNQLQRLFPLSSVARRTVEKGRKDIINILSGIDKRLLVLVGPCSVHDYDEMLEISYRNSLLAKKYIDKMVLVERVCLDKPRTKKDWPGFLNDPKLDGTYDIPFGYKRGAKLMSKILDMELAISCEVLTPISFHILSNRVSFSWVGARTVTSPDVRNAASGVRNTASGVSVPIGIKNSNGSDNITDALNAMEFVTKPGVFPGPDDDGVCCRVVTKGNPNPVLILRGAKSGPNYKEEFVSMAVQELKKRGLSEKIIVDCSHGNCGGDYRKQVDVARDVVRQRVSGNHNLVGLMFEGYHEGGKQTVKLGEKDSRKKVKPRLSVTDACLPQDDLEKLLEEIYLTLK